MGTRNLTCVIKDNEFKVAQYCQWDGYPSGQGATALNFLKGWNREQFETNLAKCAFIDNDTVQKLWAECGAGDASGWVSLEVSEVFKKEYPHLHRDCGADVLQMIQQAEDGLQLNDQHTFAADGLFCEWVYVIDLDRDVLDVYAGFVKEGDGVDHGAFADLKPAEHSSDVEYGIVARIASFPFGDLPSEEDFVAHLEKLTEEDEDAEAA